MHKDTHFYKWLGVCHHQQLQTHSGEHYSCLKVDNFLIRNHAELITALLPLPWESVVHATTHSQGPTFSSASRSPLHYSLGRFQIQHLIGRLPLRWKDCSLISESQRAAVLNTGYNIPPQSLVLHQPHCGCAGNGPSLLPTSNFKFQALLVPVPAEQVHRPRRTIWPGISNLQTQQHSLLAQYLDFKTMLCRTELSMWKREVI